MCQRLKKETKQWIVTCITEELALSTTLIDADTIPEVIKLGKKRGIDPDNIMSIVLYKHVKSKIRRITIWIITQQIG